MLKMPRLEDVPGKRKKLSSLTVQAISKAALAVLVVSFAAGCSSGGSSGTDGNTLVLVPDTGGSDMGGSDMGGSDMGGSDMGGSDMGGSDMGGSDTGGVSMDDPSALSQLYGRAIFGHRFTNDDTFFIFDGMFGSEDLAGESFDDLVLRDTVSAAIREDPDGEFRPLQSEVMICGFIESTEQFLCNVFLDSGSSANFLFDTLVNNESFGSFTFCSEEQDSSQCVDELVNSPDGTVLVAVTPQTIASRINLRNLDIAKNLPNDTSIVPYLEYENQGSANSLSSRSSAQARNGMPVLIVFEELKAKARAAKSD